MLEIAGGIVIAVAVLVALTFILMGAIWAVAVGVALAVVVGAYFFLSSVVGSGWAIGILLSALLVWIGWSGNQEDKREKANAEEKARAVRNQEAKRFAEQEKWEREQRDRMEAWQAQEQDRKDREKKEREVWQAAFAARKDADKEMCIKALRDGRDVIAIDGRKMTLADFEIYD